MSLYSLQLQLSEKEKDLSNLKNLRSLLSSLEGHTSIVCATLKEASVSIEKAGSIGNSPFDNGKTKEYAIEFEKSHANIENAISAVDADIKSVELEIQNLNNQIAIEKARIAREQQRKKEENEKKNLKDKADLN